MPRIVLYLVLMVVVAACARRPEAPADLPGPSLPAPVFEDDGIRPLAGDSGTL